jgi:hypothetical protein
MAQHVNQDPNTPPDIAHDRYPDSCCNQISKSSHRRHNDRQALGEQIANTDIQSRPKERTNRVIYQEGSSGCTFDSGQWRSDTIQARNELRYEQTTQTPSLENLVGPLRTIVWVAAKRAQYSHNLSSPVPTRFKPDEVSREAPKKAHSHHETDVYLAAVHQGSRR